MADGGGPSGADVDDDGDPCGPSAAGAAPRGARAGKGRRLHTQLMEAMVWQFLFLGWDVVAIAENNRTFDNTVVESTVRAVLKRYDDTGFVDYLPRASRERLMPLEHLNMLLSIVGQNPWLYLQEIADTLRVMTGATYTRNYVYASLIRAGYSHKVMVRAAAQRDQLQRAQYWEDVSMYIPHPSCLVFGDETGLDGRTARRKRGWGHLGSPVCISEILFRGAHVSVLALYTREDGFAAWAYTMGGYDTATFLEHIEVLIKAVMQPYPGPNSVLCLDNCQIHHVEELKLRRMCAAEGAHLIFLAPYCPIDNPIEPGFSVFKSCWRRNSEMLIKDKNQFPTLDSAISWCMANCYTDITDAGNSAPDGPEHTYNKFGYAVPDAVHAQSIIDEWNAGRGLVLPSLSDDEDSD
mmetsp:Transcript_35098/g.87488  ORF Transcript_35098/g.87488 Transcript_35098/m.87488 type:complete len:408 (+) Transcript_35098:63-1286(+)